MRGILFLRSELGNSARNIDLRIRELPIGSLGIPSNAGGDWVQVRNSGQISDRTVACV